ncbi:MAG TPA: hypothetical protein VES01_05260 [Dermatophilaceae bacterium]|nr:hypothetical protein [Dermatophilaceae bacterium]
MDGSVVVAEDVGVGAGEVERDRAAVGLVGLEDAQGLGVDVDNPSAAGLGDLGGVGQGHVDRAPEADPAGGEVDVGPAQREGLGAAHAGVGEGAPQREQVVVQLIEVPSQEGTELFAGPGNDLGLLRADLAGPGRVDGARLLRGVEQDQPVVDGSVKHRGEQDVDLGNGVGRQRLAEARLVLPPGGLQLAVVSGDAGGGELVDAERAEVRRDVVAQDLLVALDGGVLKSQASDPVVGVLGDGRGLGLEPRV